MQVAFCDTVVEIVARWKNLTQSIDTSEWPLWYKCSSLSLTWLSQVTWWPCRGRQPSGRGGRRWGRSPWSRPLCRWRVGRQRPERSPGRWNLFQQTCLGGKKTSYVIAEMFYASSNSKDIFCFENSVLKLKLLINVKQRRHHQRTW